MFEKIRLLVVFAARFFVDGVKEMFSARPWREFFRFVWKLAKDAPISYKFLYRKAVNKASMPASPIRKSSPVSAPGDNAYHAIVVRVLAGGIITGGLVGAIFSTFHVPWWSFGALLLLFPVLGYQIANYRLGYIGECVVGAELDKDMRTRDWRVFHSCIIGENKGDIDHIIVCQKGVFCIETKTWRSYSGQGGQISLENGAIKIKGVRPDYKTVKQARKNAKDLNEFLEQEVRECLDREQRNKFPFVVPVIVFPGWRYVVESRGGDVHICKHERISNVVDGFSDNGKSALSPDLVAAVCAALEKHNRINIEDIL